MLDEQLRENSWSESAVSDATKGTDCLEEDCLLSIYRPTLFSMS